MMILLFQLEENSFCLQHHIVCRKGYYHHQERNHYFLGLDALNDIESSAFSLLAGDIEVEVVVGSLLHEWL